MDDHATTDTQGADTTSHRDLTITYYGYNGFILRSGDQKVAIDPGASLYLLGLGPVIPKRDWDGVTHVLVTHADPDHYWHADRLVSQCNASLICGDELVETRDGTTFICHPRRPKVDYAVPLERVFPLRQGEEIDVDGMHIRSLPARHGELRLSFMFGAIKKTVVREPDTLFAKGETGFLFELGGVTVANLGDTLLLPDWEGLRPDVLMIPIGGQEVGNTMDEDQALEAVASIQPKLVIPCHYDGGIMFRKNANPANAVSFKERGEAMGVDSVVLEPGQSTVYRATRSAERLMSVEELDRFGAQLQMPKEAVKKQNGIMLRAVKERFGYLGMLGIFKDTLANLWRLKREHPETRQKAAAISAMIEKELFVFSAFFLAIAKRIGRDAAYEFFRTEVLDEIAQTSMAHLYQVNDLKKCEGDAFENFKRFNIAMFERTTEDGTWHMESYLDEPDKLTVNVTTCANVDLFGELGVPELGKFGCDHDLAGYPVIEADVDCDFRRQCTIAKGDDSCVFEFYRRGTAPNNAHLNK